MSSGSPGDEDTSPGSGTGQGDPVQRLEERLGMQLLQRTTRRVAPTEAGRTYHQYSVRILADAEAAEQAAGALHREPRGTL